MPKKFKVEVGDVFAVPLPKGGYGVGRIIHISDRWRLAQFFDLKLDEPGLLDSVADYEEVMPVHNIVTLRIEDGSWPVLQKGVTDALPDLRSLVFYKGLPARRTYVNLCGEAVPECHGRSGASSMPQFAEYITEVLEEALEGRA